MCTLAQLKAMNGDFDVARTLCRRGRALLRDLGQGVHAASTGLDLAAVELLGGDLKLAEDEVRADFEFLSRMGETYYLSSMASLLARLVREQGRDGDALQLSQLAESASAADDLVSQALWRSVRAPILARAGDVSGAEQMARAAVELLREMEAPSLQADVLFELATVLRYGAQESAASQFAGEAKALYEAKGNVVAAKRCAEWLAGAAAEMKGKRH